MENMKKIVLGIGGSSGSIYARLLMDALAQRKDVKVGVIMSTNARINWELEMGSFNKGDYPFDFYGKSDFMAPFASGSARYETMVICPCSMGLIGRISSGLSNDLMTRAADVMLKERRRLILVPRETPYNLIHLENMKTITRAGGIICPATPSFYSQPKDIEELCMTVVDRVIDLMGLEQDTYRWGENKNDQ